MTYTSYAYILTCFGSVNTHILYISTYFHWVLIFVGNISVENLKNLEPTNYHEFEKPRKFEPSKKNSAHTVYIHHYIHVMNI